MVSLSRRKNKQMRIEIMAQKHDHLSQLFSHEIIEPDIFFLDPDCKFDDQIITNLVVNSQ